MFERTLIIALFLLYCGAAVAADHPTDHPTKRPDPIPAATAKATPAAVTPASAAVTPADPAKPSSTDPVARPKPKGNPLHPKVEMKTSLGSIVLELDAEKAPVTVLNFLRYAEEKYYENTVFHRVMKDFMIQGGGFDTKMDKKEKGLHPPIVNEWRNGLKNKYGTVAMARTSAPDSATSQFFINVKDNAQLDMGRPAAYCVFGKVVDGIEVVEKIRNAKVIRHPKYPSGTVTPDPHVVIQSVKLISAFDKEGVIAKLKKSKKALATPKAMAPASQSKEAQALVAKIEAETKIKAQKTKSGIYYFVLKEGSGASPKSTDSVKANYKGMFLDGSVFDSSEKHGGPLTFALNGVIPAWTECIAMMKVGGKRKLVIPPEMGYGKIGFGTTIPPDTWLVFEIEFLSIL